MPTTKENMRRMSRLFHTKHTTVSEDTIKQPEQTVTSTFVAPQPTNPSLYDIKRVIKACQKERATHIRCYNMVDDPDICLYHYHSDARGFETHEFHLPFSKASIRMHTESPSPENKKALDTNEFTRRVFTYFTVDNCMRQQYDNLRYNEYGIPHNRLIMIIETESTDWALQTFLGRITSAAQGLDVLFEKVMIRANNKSYSIAL